jgi:hypothetical protein
VGGEPEFVGGRWHWRGGWQNFGWVFTVPVLYREREESFQAPYPVWISASPALDREPGAPLYRYRLLPGGYRRGSVDLGPVELAIGLWDFNVDGRYDDIDNLGVVIDTDLDGELCLYCVHELFGAFFSPGEPLRVAGKLYRLRVSPSGLQVELHMEAEGEPLPVLIPAGSPFPELAGETIWGEQFSLSALRGKVVALFFLPHRLFCSQPPAWEELCRRPLEVAELVADNPDVQVVVILTDEAPPEEARWESLRELGGRVLWAPEAKQEFRFGNGFLLLDREGMIRYTDEILELFRDRHGLRLKHDFVPATALDILWAIDTLLEEN